MGKRTSVHPVAIGAMLFLIGGLFTKLPAQQQWPTYDKLDSSYTAQDMAWDSLHRETRIDSANLEAWLHLIEICKKRGDFDNELLFAAMAARHVPGSPHSQFALADARLNNGLVEEALPPLQSAIRIESCYVRALTVLAEAYDMLYQHDTALLYLDSAIICNPRNAQAHFQRAELLYRIGRRVESIESYRAWAELQPFTAEPWIKLGEAQCLVGDYQNALESLNYALTLNENSPDALFLVATAVQGTGRIDQAREAFRDFFFRFPTHKKALEAEEMARALGWKPGGE